MQSKYKVIFIITTLLLILSVSTAIINYFVAIDTAQKQLKEQSLPLSLDNIYSEIQKNIVQPYLVSSMMANDTFVKDWIINSENNNEKIEQYLDSINNKYKMFSSFLVSDKTKNYYTQNGYVETLNENKDDNKWYFEFKKTTDSNEINIDHNQALSNSLIMFINYKIFDSNFHFIGATGVAIKIEYIDEMLKSFRQKYGFKVTFFNKEGQIVLAERDLTPYENIESSPLLKSLKNKLISKENQILEINQNSEKYLLSAKYIPELNLYLAVEAKLDDYLKDAKNTFYFNLFISLFITFLVAWIIFNVIKKYNFKLEYMAFNDSLTGLYNRRHFEEVFSKQIHLFKRQKQNFSILFMDIDNFKNINDTHGHEVGDFVIKNIAKLLKQNLRESDTIARWGGEEFVVLLQNSNSVTAFEISEKIRNIIQNSVILHDAIGKYATASFGVTEFLESDSMDLVLSRVDKAMYTSKTNGKNMTTLV